MSPFLAKSILVVSVTSMGLGAYACSNSSPSTSEDSGAGSSSGASGSSSGTASGSSSGVSGSGSSSGASADAGETFTDLYATVLGPSGPYGCTSHHAGGQADSFLDLGDASAAYASLVNAHAAGPKCGDGGTTDLRVAPGSPSTSLLWLKVWTLPDGGNEVPCGVQMPYNPDGGEISAHPLVSGDETKVKSWIAGGALKN